MFQKLLLSIILFNTPIAHSMQDPDLELALKLSLEDQDYQLALQLQREYQGHGAENFNHGLGEKAQEIPVEKVQLYAQAQITINPLILLCNNAYDMDVHKFNRQMNWKKNYLALNDLHTKIGFDTPYVRYTPQKFFELFQNTPRFIQLLEGEKVNFAVNRDLLLRHIRSNNCEKSETKASMDILLSKIWALSCDRGDNHKELGALLIPSLIDNTTTGGGCYPGFAGRLCYVYLSLLNKKTLGQ